MFKALFLNDSYVWFSLEKKLPNTLQLIKKNTYKLTQQNHFKKDLRQFHKEMPIRSLVLFYLRQKRAIVLEA